MHDVFYKGGIQQVIEGEIYISILLIYLCYKNDVEYNLGSHVYSIIYLYIYVCVWTIYIYIYIYRDITRIPSLVYILYIYYYIILYYQPSLFFTCVQMPHAGPLFSAA